MRQGLLYVFAAAALVLIVSVAWWTRERLQQDVVSYVVRPGDTARTIAEDHGVTVVQLAEANQSDEPEPTLTPGDTVLIPSPSPTPATVWFTHLIGIAGEMLGVFMSLWLALVAGLLPRTIRRQVVGISVVIGLTSYASTYAVVGTDVLLTPAYLFGTIKDGFAWAAAFPMLARAIGIQDVPPAGSTARDADVDTPPPPAPAASPGPTA